MSSVFKNTIERIQSAVNVYDLCLAWEWEFDADFAQLLNSACVAHGLSLLQITPGVLGQLLPLLTQREITFSAFLDRASDVDTRFLDLIDWVRSQKVLRINQYRLARQAWNKVFCQNEFSHKGLATPATIFIPSYHEDPDTIQVDLASLGSTFSIKPAHGGGGRGVVNEATAWEQVISARQDFPFDQYLLQASVTPAEMFGRKAWFRILYCTGEIYPCWWDTQTHVYTPFIATPDLKSLEDCFHDNLAKIASICKLELFSTEVAYTEDAGCVIVDYINDPVDLRLQSRAADGVPDEIVASIANRLATLVASST